MALPNMCLIPSGYKPTKLYSVLPESGDADFDVTRATPATRVNQYGLIETPEFIVSGDLITNGDFSDGSTDWTLGTGWTISGGSANCDGTQTSGTQLYQTGTYTLNTMYKITYTATVTAGNFDVRLQGVGAIVIGSSRTISGTYTDYLISTGNTSFRIRGSSTFTGSIDNVSVVQVERNNIPRLDYTDGGCPVLLTEPQSTNLVTNSNNMLASNWSQTTAAVTLSSNLNPSGDSVCYRVERIGSGSQLGGVTVATIGETYTSSIYLRRISGSGIVNMKDVNNGSTSVTITDEWQKYSTTGVANSANARYYYTLDADGDVIEASFAQLEANKSYATSYIPTNGSAVTRNQDLVNNAGTSATYNSVEGVLFAEISALANDGTNRAISIDDGSLNNSINLFYTGNISDNSIRALILSGSATVAQMNYSLNIIDNHKIAIKYKQNDFSLWVDGVEVVTDTTGNTPIGLNNMNFSQGGGTSDFYGKTSQVQVFNTALSDFDLRNLTSNATGYATYETMRTSLNFNIQ